jgi:hypothetical protein
MTVILGNKFRPSVIEGRKKVPWPNRKSHFVLESNKEFSRTSIGILQI